MLGFFKKRQLRKRPKLALNRPVYQKAKFRFNLLISSSICILGLLAFVVFSPFFKIANIDFERDDFSIDPSMVLSELSSSKGRNIFFLSLSEIESFLLKKNPIFKNVSITRKFPDTLIVKLETYENIFIVHGFSYLEDEKGIKKRILKDFYVSKAGEIKDIVDEKPLALPEIFIKEALDSIEAGEIVISNYQMKKILNVLDSIKDYEFDIISVDLYLKGREIRVETNRGYLWITFSKDIDKQLAKILLFWQKYGKKKEFQYLDLRIDSRIVYK